jgi:phosphoenolpyruvate synthase/pyruvate phosphate dikinase
LSTSLDLIKVLGIKLGFTPEQMAYADFNTIKELYFSSSSEQFLLSKSIEIGKERYKNTLSTSLPPLIIQPTEIFGFEWPITSPNFITQNCVTAFVTSNLNFPSLSEKIVCIPNADPGFDWLFSHNIAGLVTAWGGANSHMAIRAGELGLPAVIGCGELLFNVWSKAEKLQIDCANNRVDVIL